MRILFIGNSHTYFNDMPHLCAELLRAAGALEGLKDTNQVTLTELMGDPGGAQTSLL